MTEKQIEKMKQSLPFGFRDMTEEQKKTYHELQCREMINSILIYNVRPGQNEIWNSWKKNYTGVVEWIMDYGKDGKYLTPYINEKNKFGYLGEKRVKELIREQLNDYENCEVGYAGHDHEGCYYNYCKWADEQEEEDKENENEIDETTYHQICEMIRTTFAKVIAPCTYIGVDTVPAIIHWVESHEIRVSLLNCDKRIITQKRMDSIVNTFPEVLESGYCTDNHDGYDNIIFKVKEKC